MTKKDKYEFHRGFLNIITGIGNDLSEEERGDKRFSYLAFSTVMKTVFSGLYKTLIERKEMKPIEEMPQEYKQELWEIAFQFMPGASREDRTNYCHCVMSMLWLMNNYQ